MNAANFGTDLFACEISTSGLEAIRSRGLSRLKGAVLFDGYQIPYADKQFELATCTHVLEHVEHERLLLAELRRVAKQVAIEVPLDYNVGRERNVERSMGAMDPYGHINLYSPATVLNLLKTSGLRPIRWKVLTSSVRYEQYLYGKSKGLVKNTVRRAALALLPRFAPLLLTYVMTVNCDCDA